MENQPQNIQVKIDDATLKGSYANGMQVLHTQEEFVLDFMNLFPPNNIVSARVIVSPGHLKRMILALEENLKNYEKNFGQIKIAQAPPSQIGFKAE